VSDCFSFKKGGENGRGSGREGKRVTPFQNQKKKKRWPHKNIKFSRGKRRGKGRSFGGSIKRGGVSFGLHRTNGTEILGGGSEINKERNWKGTKRME